MENTNTTEYDMHICKCGAIHFIPESLIGEALDKEKDIFHICTSCGAMQYIGADIDYTEDGKEYMMYRISEEADDFVIDENSFNNVDDNHAMYKIIASKGFRPLMQSGHRATSYLCDTFFDDTIPDELYTGFDKDEFKKWLKERKQVNMERLLQNLDDDKLEVLSHYHIPALNFKGTLFEKEWS